MIIKRIKWLRLCQTQSSYSVLVREWRRDLRYLIPGLNAKEEEYIRTQTHLLSNTRFTNDVQQRARCGKDSELPTTSTGALTGLHSEVRIRRLEALLDVVGIQDYATRELSFTLLNQMEKSQHSKYNQNAYRNTSLRILLCVTYKIEKHLIKDLLKPRVSSKTARSVLNLHNIQNIVENQFKHLHLSNETFNSDPPNELNFLKSNGTMNYRLFIENRVNVMRSSYIAQNILGVDPSAVDLYCPIETLIELNLMDRMLFQNLDQKYRDNVIKEGFQQKVINQRLVFTESAPISAFYHLLSDIGFSNEDASEILFLQGEFNLFKMMMKKVQKHFQNDLNLVVEEYSRRIEYLKNQEIIFKEEPCPFDIFTSVIQWDNLLEAIKKFPHMPIRYKFLKKNYPIIPVPVPNMRYSKSSRSLKGFLHTVRNRFGEEGTKRLENATRFFRTYDQVNYIQNLNQLSCQGFTVQQIGQGLEVLVYPPTQLRQIIAELDCDNKNQDWRSHKHAVPKLAYFIEKKKGFPEHTYK